jgi:hypothetical protein
MTILNGGAAVLPIVKPTSAPMASKKYPGRFRPELEIVGWRDLSGKPVLIEAPKLAEIGKPVTEPTTAEKLNDQIGF